MCSQLACPFGLVNHRVRHASLDFRARMLVIDTPHTNSRTRQIFRLSLYDPTGSPPCRQRPHHSTDAKLQRTRSQRKRSAVYRRCHFALFGSNVRAVRAICDAEEIRYFLHDEVSLLVYNQKSRPLLTHQSRYGTRCRRETGTVRQGRGARQQRETST